MVISLHPSSFRDPSGFVFLKNDLIYRQVNLNYSDNYDFFITSGLYAELTSKNLLVTHKEVDSFDRTAYKTLLPEQISFISYPYEWCFSQLKDAALLTLSVHLLALKKGMWLKDCSSFNVQFQNGVPIFIDTLSFEPIQDLPWPAYRQFCEHFLAPLLLSYYTKENMNILLKTYPDGIPLNIVSKLLPIKSFGNMGALLNIHVHNKLQSNFGNSSNTNERISVIELTRIANNLKDTIEKLTLLNKPSLWESYYKNDSSECYFEAKKKLVEDFVLLSNAKTCWDFGSNTGEFSELVANLNLKTIALEADHSCVENLYKKRNAHILPLVMNIANPTPSLGFNSEERLSLIQRGPVDVGLVLALTHHLAIAHTIPFYNQARFFSSTCKYLIVEFVPKSDEKIKLMLKNRVDVFHNYSQAKFEEEFSNFFDIIEYKASGHGGRILYLLKRKPKID